MRELLLLCLFIFNGFHLARSAKTVFNPNSLPVDTRLSWCKDQMNSCVELCAGPGLGANSCDHMTLNFACTCSNGTAPGLDYYMRTMPTFICGEIKKGCAGNDEGDAAAEKQCADASKSTCGTLDPVLANKQPDSKATSTTATTTGTETKSTGTSTSTPESSSPPSSGEDGKPPVGLLAAVVAGILVFVGALAGGFYWLGKRRSAQKKRKSAMVGAGGGTEDDKDKARSYKMLHDDSGASQWSLHEIHTSKEIPIEMDSCQTPSTLSELPSPNASHFVAELDGRMMPSVVAKPATTYNQDDGRKYQMPKEER
ncbi:hypothetical protein PG987_015674 [Apiospora arundinis]